MTYIYSTPFRGSSSGSECAGSAARKVRQNYNECPPNQPECDTVNFRGRGDSPYYTEKKRSPLGGMFLTLLGAAGVIAGLGFAHKKGAIDKLKDGKFKDKFAEPVTNWCHEACAWTKDKGNTAWSKVKSIFSRKKGD